MNRWRQIPINHVNQNEYVLQQFLKHAALELHYERLKMANANNHETYYQYAELQYYHKSRAIHFKSYFSATSLV